MSSVTVVAVIDSVGEDAAVWAVSAIPGLDRTLSRLGGAWVLPVSDLPTLHLWASGTALLATERGLTLAGSVSAGLQTLRPSSALDRVSDWQRRLQKEFDAEQDRRSKSKQLDAPRWPDLARLGPPAEPEPNVTADAGALQLARWTAKLIDVVIELRNLQSARPYLNAAAPELADPTPVQSAG